jgi:hypothetical protein
MSPCPPIDTGRSEFVDSCQVSCFHGYEELDGGCVSECGDRVPVCEAHDYAKDVCQTLGTNRYTCAACEIETGKQMTNFTLRPSKNECHQTDCDPGSYGSGGVCHSCPVNSYSGAAGMGECTACGFGKYQPNEGANECLTCFVDSIEMPANACGPGAHIVTSILEIVQYFSMVNGTEEFNDSPLTDNMMRGFCQQGYACLPCPPGSRAEHGNCTACTTGTYQPHFMATTCFECSAGQTTRNTGATRNEECVCVGGFE